ncbi:hypothetical protein [Pedobacter psychrodurus]|uniref:hypothetical protein n=1 Tax=Pedobacter psychrodurus TaxID=2530456 RepID=UPI00292EB2AA|nr:hypothetical protein [Pedobacter psychrodurus]
MEKLSEILKKAGIRPADRRYDRAGLKRTQGSDIHGYETYGDQKYNKKDRWEILKSLGKKLRAIISISMEQYSNAFKENLVVTSKTVVLDYLFGEGEDMAGYQLVCFSQGAPWCVLSSGYLLGNLSKLNGIWIATDAGPLDGERILSIGRFIDSQHFNLLPDKIKLHWGESVAEVIMYNDSSYMVVCRDGIEFEHFKCMFCAYIAELVEEERAVVFNVYNAGFSEDFKVEVS